MIGNTPGRLQPLFILQAFLQATLILIFILALSACGKKAGPAGPAPRNVLTAKVTTKDVPFYLDEIGTTSAYETVQVQAQVTGQIISREFKDGGDVKKGDLLFKIDPRPYEAILASGEGRSYPGSGESEAATGVASQECDRDPGAGHCESQRHAR